MNKIQIELIENHLHYKELLNPLYETLKSRLKTEDNVFHEEIRKEFEDKCKWKITGELANNLQMTLEDVIISVEDINWEKYLK